ncbi:MAG: hypothetical protein ABW123_08240 [Cystobacter sp.]
MYEHIWKLSVHDRKLSTRFLHKSRAAKEARSCEQFVTAMRDSREDGKAFTCFMTRAWVTEVFEGLERQYLGFKHDDGLDGSKAGFRVCSGDAIQEAFRRHAGSEAAVIFHVRHTGTEDHVLTIEQLSRGRGYRIYQSFGGAYSLRAWLSDNTGDLFEADTGDIIVWKKLHEEVNEQLAQMSQGRASLTHLEALPDAWTFLRPYCEFVRDYDEAQVMANFERAWERYGKGRVLTQTEFFEDYLVKLTRLEAYFRQNDHQGTPFPREIWDAWIEQYASPNSLHYPGLPHNFATDLLLPGRHYRLEILDVVLPSDEAVLEAECAMNARILGDSVVR